MYAAFRAWLFAATTTLAAQMACQGADFKPPIAPGFYHADFIISDMHMSRVVEIHNVRQDPVLQDGGFMDVRWVGMWPHDPQEFIPTGPNNGHWTTGVFHPKGIQIVLPEVSVSRKIDVYYFTFAPKANADGIYVGSGDVPYEGPNGAGKNKFTCDLVPLKGWKLPQGKQP